MQYFGFKIERTKKGLPAIWEVGGGDCNIKGKMYAPLQVCLTLK